MSRAQEIAREAVALKVSTLDNYRKLDLVAKYAVNLALEAAAKECVMLAEECGFGEQSATCHQADAAAIRAMKEKR